MAKRKLAWLRKSEIENLPRYSQMCLSRKNTPKWFLRLLAERPKLDTGPWSLIDDIAQSHIFFQHADYTDNNEEEYDYAFAKLRAKFDTLRNNLIATGYEINPDELNVPGTSGLDIQINSAQEDVFVTATFFSSLADHTDAGEYLRKNGFATGSPEKWVNLDTVEDGKTTKQIFPIVRDEIESIFGTGNFERCGMEMKNGEVYLYWSISGNAFVRINSQLNMWLYKSEIIAHVDFSYSPSAYDAK